VGSIPDEAIGFFSLPNPSSRTMTLGSTQPLTEMGTRYLPGGKGRAAVPNPSSRTMTLGSTQSITEMGTRYLPGGYRAADS
jgi:hypothetical protein